MIAENSDISNNDLLAKIAQTIREEGKKNKQEITSDINKQIIKENEKLLKKIDEQNIKLNLLESKYNKLEIRCINLERHYRKNNILIFGLEIPENKNLLHYTVEKLNALLEVNILVSDINNLYHLRPNDKGTPIKVEFVTYIKKIEILKNANKLKGTRIFIAQDFCLEDRQDNKVLNEHYKLARSKNCYAKIKGKTLQINDEVYTLAQLKQMKIDRPIELVDSVEVEVQSKSNSAPPTPQQGSSFDFELNITSQELPPKHTSITQVEKVAKKNNLLDKITNKGQEKEDRTGLNLQKKEDKPKLQRNNSTTKEPNDRVTRQKQQSNKT